MAKKTSEVLGGVSRQAQTLSKQALEDKRVCSAQIMPFGWPQNLVSTGALNDALAKFSSQRQSAGMFVVTTEGKSRDSGKFCLPCGEVVSVSLEYCRMG